MTDAAYGQTWAQLLDAEQALRALAEGQVREYAGTLEKLAHSLAPAEADARKRGDPAYFKRLTAAGWLAFFAGVQGAQGQPVNAGWSVGAADGAAPNPEAQELARLRGELRVVQAENNRLRDLTQGLRQEKTALAAALKEKERTERTATQGARTRVTPAPAAAAEEAGPVEPGAVEPPGQPDPSSSGAAQPVAQALPAPPPKYARLFDNWPVQGQALVDMATTGWSLRQAVMRRLAEQLGVNERDKSLHDVFAPLAQRNLIHQATESVDGTVAAGARDGQVRIGIVRLANLGQRVLNEIGVKPIPSEWGRLEARDGAEQVKRIAWACALADHARQRGYVVEVCPTVGQPARADALLTRADERIYVTVCGADPQPAWDKLVDKDGALGLCAPTRQVRNDLVAAAKAAGVSHGRATDLELLLSESVWKFLCGRIDGHEPNPGYPTGGYRVADRTSLHQ
jgi:hypothetical protein